MKREEVLCALESSPESFIQVLRSHKSSDGEIDLCEFLQTLPRKLQGRVWTALLHLTHGVAGRLLQQDEGDTNISPEKDGTQREVEDKEVLSGVVAICQLALGLDDLHITMELSETFQIIHDVLLSIPEEWSELQNEMSRVCEMCWVRGEEVEGREQLVPNCLLYVIARTFSQGASVKDVGRVWGMRGALLLLDFEDPSADSIKELLLSTLMEPLYITSRDGRKLLSYLFGLHPSFVDSLHQTIRNQIPWCPKAYLEIYGEVYFKAWRLASGPYLKKIEEGCIQDLMYTAVHANRSGPRSAFSALRKLLGYIHHQSQHSGVQEMVHRLYNPFLWRSLKVANAHVRANAVCLMLDAFPLHDPGSSREDIDGVLQKQFDLMTELLYDDSPMVRCLATLGVGRVLGRYWELVPLSVIKSLLHKMIRELAYDTSSDDVRVAVIQSLSVLLENRLSHSLLSNLLPLLHHHIHDTSVKVRIAFLDLLLVIRGIRNIKFYEVCPIPHLLSRMDVDSIHVVKRIVSLLVSSFQPSHVPLSEQVARCLTLIEMNMSAARRFYQLAVANLPPSHTVRFMLGLFSTIRHAVKEEMEGGERNGEEGGKGGGGIESSKKTKPSGRSRGRKKKMEKENKSKNHLAKEARVKKAVEDEEEEEEEEEGERDPSGIVEGGWKEGEKDNETSNKEPPSLSDRDLLSGALEVIVILWEGVKEKLDESKNSKLRLRLVSSITKSLPLFFNTLTDGRCRSALYFLASFLPRSSVSSIASGTLETLSSLDNNSQEYAAMVTAMSSWKQIGEVVGLISHWFKSSLEEEVPHPLNEAKRPGSTVPIATKNHKRTKTKTSGEKLPGATNKGRNEEEDSNRPKPQLALNILNYILVHPVCREEMRREGGLAELELSLHPCLSVLSDHFTSDVVPEHLTFDLLKQMVGVYVRLALHKAAGGGGGGGGGGGEGGGGEGGGCDVVRERVREIREWTEVSLLPLLRGDLIAKSQPAKRHSNRKRKANQSQPTVLTSDLRVKEGCQVTETLLGATTEGVMIGLVDGELQLELAQWAGAIAETGVGIALLRPLTKLMYQLAEVSVLGEVEGIRAVTSLEPTSSLLHSLLLLLTSLSSPPSPEEFKKAWSVLSGGVSQVMTVSLRLHTLSLSPHPIPTFTTLTNITMSLLTQEAKECPSRQRTLNSSSLPLLPSAVLNVVSRNENHVSLFLSHLQSWLEEAGEDEDEEEEEEEMKKEKEEEREERAYPHSLLCHLTALHPLHLLTADGRGGDEAMQCLRCSLRYTNQMKKNLQPSDWSDDVLYLTESLERLQDKLYSQ